MKESSTVNLNATLTPPTATLTPTATSTPPTATLTPTGTLTPPTATLTLHTKRVGMSCSNQMAFTQSNELWLSKSNGALAERLPLPPEVQQITCLRFSTDGRFLFVATGGRILVRVELASRKNQLIKTLHPVWELDVTPTGLVYSDGKQLHSVDLETGRESRLITSPRLFPDGGGSALQWKQSTTWTVAPAGEPSYLLAA